MENNQDSGLDTKTTENDVGSFNEEGLAAVLRKTLYADEQGETQPETLNEGEDQTEDKFAEDTSNIVSEDSEPQAEDGDTAQVERVDDDEELPRGVQKRIDKLTAFRKQAEEQVSELKKQVDELRSKLETKEQEAQEATQTNSASRGDNPFSHLQDLSSIEQEAEKARWLKYKCEENPDGFEHSGEFYSAEQVRSMKVNAMKALELHLPKQKAALDAKAALEPIIDQTYPWWKNKESKEYQLAQQVLKHYPDFKRFPDYKLFVGDYVRGFIARETTALAAKAKAKPAQNLGIRQTANPSRIKSNGISTRAAKAQLSKQLDEDSLTSYLMSSNII
jgi:hypothetical protein